MNVDTTEFDAAGLGRTGAQRRIPLHCVLAQRLDPESFFESGEEDYELLVAPVFDRYRWQAQGKAMLELGCGAGRMTRSFAQRFSRVYAFDISAEMLAPRQGPSTEARPTWIGS